MAKKQQDIALDYKAVRKDIQSNTCQGLYVFYGDETFLLNHYLKAMKNHLIDPLTESFNYHHFTAETFSADAFSDSVDNLPMMAEQTMILLEDIDLFSLPDDGRDRLASVLNSIPEYCTIVISYISIPWKPDKRKKKLWDAISDSGKIIEYKKLDTNDLIPWLERSFRERKKRISTNNIRHLIELTDGTLSMLLSEINKICAYSNSEEICQTDIDMVVDPVLEVIIFQMTDQMTAGQYDLALKSLAALLKQQEPVTILGAIGAAFRRMYAARILSDKGKSSFELARLCGIHEYPARKLMESAKKNRKSYISKACDLVLETDWALKNSTDSETRLLEMLIIRLSMESSHGKT